MRQSTATQQYRNRHLEQMLLSQLRSELAQRFPGAESSEEARRWESKRWAEIRKEHGL